VAQAVAALGMTVANVVVHMAGFFIVFAYLQYVRRHGLVSHGLTHILRVLLAATVCIIVLHGIEVAMWAVLFRWVGAFPDAATALYFSLGSYSTVGAKGIALPHQWRMLEGVEALVGALMFGLSTAFIFSVITVVKQMWQNHQQEKQGLSV
jgi:hypothetical protein